MTRDIAAGVANGADGYAVSFGGAGPLGLRLERESSVRGEGWTPGAGARAVVQRVCHLARSRGTTPALFRRSVTASDPVPPSGPGATEK